MQNLKTEIAEKIKINRPKLEASSLKTYVSILFNIHKAMKIEDTNMFVSSTTLSNFYAPAFMYCLNNILLFYALLFSPFLAPFCKPFKFLTVPFGKPFIAVISIVITSSDV